jgi:glycosyltransferase involved in cell wall biosynthesis
MRLLALTRGVNLPSSRFRVRQHIPALAAAGIEVTDAPPRVDPSLLMFGLDKRIRQRYLLPLAAMQLGANVVARLPDLAATARHDATWIQRTVVPGFDALVRLVRGPRILDVDDAIWLEGLGGRWVPYLASHVDAIIAGNAYLADYFSRYCKNVRVVPTAIDTDRFRVARREARRPFTIGWTGTSGNFQYLKLIEGALRTFLSTHRDARFMVIADRDPRRVLTLPEGQVVFRAWTVDSEVAGLAEMDLGVMPLEDSPWARGKCSFKMLQYMAAGIPVAVSPVGMNAEVLRMGDVGAGPESEDDWVEVFRRFHDDRHAALACGERGRSIAEREFSLTRISTELARVFRDAA